MRFGLLLAATAIGCYSAAITSGNLTISGSWPTGAFTISGPGFTAAGNHWGGFWKACDACLPGATSKPDFSLELDGPGSAIIGSTVFPGVDWHAFNSFRGGSMIGVAAPIELPGPGVFFGTFLFSGTLCGYTSRINSIPPRPCDIDLPALTGSGIYSVTVAAVQGPGPALDRLRITRADYTFGVPEPSSAWTAAAGLAALIAAARYQKNRNFTPAVRGCTTRVPTKID